MTLPWFDKFTTGLAVPRHAHQPRPELVEGRPRMHCRGSTSSPLGWQFLATHTNLVLSLHALGLVPRVEGRPRMQRAAADTKRASTPGTSPRQASSALGGWA